MLNISSIHTDIYIYFLTRTSFLPGVVEKELLSYYSDGHIAGNQIKRIQCQSYPVYNKAKATDIKSRTLSNTEKKGELSSSSTDPRVGSTDDSSRQMAFRYDATVN